jgi:ubiquinone/menaquinone biosynthesis C-methylase UbiE
VTASDRQRAAVDALEVQPNDRILELGCGHGVAATLVCDRLGPDGHLIAIDRSPKMIEAAEARNTEHVKAGQVTFMCSAFEDADLPERSFDKIFGIHFPPADRHDPAGTRERAEKLLVPEGTVQWF